MSMTDFGRFNAVTTFHCAKCGEQLRLSYRPEGKPMESMEGACEQPTGAVMHHTKLSLWPCVSCMQDGKSAVEAFSRLMKLAAEFSK